MKVILFDLGNTLEDVDQGGLLPGATETLEAILAMRDANGNAPVLALVSDFGEISGDVTLLLDLIPLVRDFSGAIQLDDKSRQGGGNALT